MTNSSFLQVASAYIAALMLANPPLSRDAAVRALGAISEAHPTASENELCAIIAEATRAVNGVSA